MKIKYFFIFFIVMWNLSCQSQLDTEVIIDSFFDEVLGEYTHPDILFYQSGDFTGSKYNEYVVFIGEDDTGYSVNRIDAVYLVIISNSGKIKEYFHTDIVSAGYSDFTMNIINSYSAMKDKENEVYLLKDLTDDEKDEIIIVTTSGMGFDLEILSFQDESLIHIFNEERYGGSVISEMKVIEDSKDDPLTICLEWPHVDTTSEDSVKYRPVYYQWDIASRLIVPISNP